VDFFLWYNDKTIYNEYCPDKKV